jgi:acetylornithine/succinyldiaminopimelate/putrescine aminotransferase
MSFKASKYPQHLAKTSPQALGLEVESAKGSYLWDKNGKRYIDLIAGISVMNLGHQHPAIVAAVKNQMDRYAHVMVYGEFVEDNTRQLSEKLNSCLPKQLNCSYFVNSGTEANEAAVKLARRHTGRSKIISFRGAYHGSTLGSLSISGNEKKKSSFRPLIPDVEFINLNEHRELEKIDGNTAAVILEPIQGDAGVRIASNEYMLALRAKCDEHGALLIFDEVQSGIGRTGKLYAFMHSEVVPDILTSGKALGGGLPIGCLISSQEIMSSFSSDPMLGHISTFGGNPVACAAALAVLTEVNDSTILDHVEAKGALLESHLQHPKIREIRRKGLMLAIDLASEEMVESLIFKALDRGLILFWFLSQAQSFRIAPPLNIDDQDLIESAEIIKEILDEIV